MVEHGQHISIGRFAGLTGISANTLRRYDELGVLSPAFTDPETRYRLYAVEQLDTGILIRLLRDLDVPLKEIAAQIGGGDPGRLRDALAVHRERIAARLVELERILQRLDGALEAEQGLLPYQIEVVTLEPRLGREPPDDDAAVAAGRASWTGVCSSWRMSSRPRPTAPRAASSSSTTTPCTGTGGSTWRCASPSPTTRPPRTAAGSSRAAIVMRTIYRGPWDDIWHAYSLMLARTARDGCEVCGPLREAYLADERDTDDPAHYVTEITWPFRPRAESFG